MKRTIITILAVLVLSTLIISLSYFWPKSALFRVVDTEVKRIGTTDQYRITAVRLSDKKRMVFRNEDAWYRFKFDSADLQGDAAIAERNSLVAEITYYGWRNNLFSWFWNASDIDIQHENEKKPEKTPE